MPAAPVFSVEEGHAASGGATVYGQPDAGAEEAVYGEATPIVGKGLAPAAAGGSQGRCVLPLLSLLIVMTGAVMAKELLPPWQASADKARGIEEQVAALELLAQANADTAKGLEKQLSDLEAKRAGTEATMTQLLEQASTDKARGFEKQVAVLEETITQLRLSSEETIEQLQAQADAQKAAAGAAGHARAHPPRVNPFLRYAKYDCQSKGSMLAGYPNPTVLEIGAFDGDEWKQFKGIAKKLWSVEPSPDKKVPLGRLREKYVQEGFSVEFFSLAVTDKTGEVKLWVEGSGSQSQLNTAGRPPPWVKQEEFDKSAVSVPASRLDDLWKNQLGRQHITMLKVDTQGHEPGVIMSGQELFAADPPEIVHMEYSPGLMRAAGFDGAKLLEFLYSFGYLCFDCAMFGPPPIANREFQDFTAHFARLLIKGADHGQWADIVCLL